MRDRLFDRFFDDREYDEEADIEETHVFRDGYLRLRGRYNECTLSYVTKTGELELSDGCLPHFIIVNQDMVVFRKSGDTDCEVHVILINYKNLSKSTICRGSVFDRSNLIYVKKDGSIYAQNFTEKKPHLMIRLEKIHPKNVVLGRDYYSVALAGDRLVPFETYNYDGSPCTEVNKRRIANLLYYFLYDFLKGTYYDELPRNHKDYYEIKKLTSGGVAFSIEGVKKMVLILIHAHLADTETCRNTLGSCFIFERNGLEDEDYENFIEKLILLERDEQTIQLLGTAPEEFKCQSVYLTSVAKIARRIVERDDRRTILGDYKKFVSFAQTVVRNNS